MDTCESEYVAESLSSARYLHRVLILVFATVLAIAASQSVQQDYSAAIAELDTLADINLREFIEISRERVQSFAKETDLARAYQNAFDSAMRHELQRRGFAVPEPSLDHEVFLPVFDENHVRAVSNDGTVADYRDLIRENVGVEYVFVQPMYLAAAFAGKIEDINFPPDAKITGMKLVMRPPLCATRSPKTFRLSMALILAVLKPTIGSYIVTVEDPPVSLVDTFDQTQLQDWLQEKEHLQNLVRAQDAHRDSYAAESILPESKPAWSLVADKTPMEAKRILLEEVQKSRQRVSLLGVEIDARWTIVAGPLVAAILAAFLFGHTRHLRRICQTTSPLPNTFPWLPLFPDRISRAVSLLTGAILPTVAFAWLLLRFRHVGLSILCTAILLSLICLGFTVGWLKGIWTLTRKQ